MIDGGRWGNAGLMGKRAECSAGAHRTVVCARHFK
jgi:hypothetical protein